MKTAITLAILTFIGAWIVLPEPTYSEGSRDGTIQNFHHAGTRWHGELQTSSGPWPFTVTDPRIAQEVKGRARLHYRQVRHPLWPFVVDTEFRVTRVEMLP